MSVNKDEIIDELLKKYPIFEIVQFDELNIPEKLEWNPYILMQYEEYLLKERMHLEELEDLKEKLVGELYHKFRFEHSEELSNKEIEKYYIPKDPKYLKMNDIIRKQKIKVGFFAYCVKGLEKQYWSMKSRIDASRRGI